LHGFFNFIEDFEMTVINTNIAATVTANAMKSNQRIMENTMERLATGMRINSAADDAAGLAIGTKMDAQIRGLQQSVRNANDAISMLQTADGATKQITDLLQRMRELAVQGRNETNSTTDLDNLNQEFSALATEIDRIADDTQFNGVSLLSSNVSKRIQIGNDELDVINLTFGDFNLAAGATAVAGIQKSAMTEGELQALDHASLPGMVTIVDSQGRSLAIDQVLISVPSSGDFSAATLANLATALNTAIDAAGANFDQVLAADIGDTTGIKFTQDTAGTGSIASLTFTAANGGANTAKAITELTPASAAAATPMAATLTDFKTATNDLVEASTTIDEVDAAIAGVAIARADFGANISRLGYTVDNLMQAMTNTQAAKSAIMDADYAAETTELARTQIISQAATAMLSQANQQQQSVLALLK
jgi:flagellin